MISSIVSVIYSACERTLKDTECHIYAFVTDTVRTRSGYGRENYTKAHLEVEPSSPGQLHRIRQRNSRIRGSNHGCRHCGLHSQLPNPWTRTTVHDRSLSRVDGYSRSGKGSPASRS